MTEESPVEPNLFPWANEESTRSVFALPKGLDDSYHDYIVFALPADCVTFAVNRKGHRNFALYTGHATVPRHVGNTMSTQSHSYRHPPQCVGGYGLLGKHEKGHKGLLGKGTVSVWFPSIVISNSHNW